MKRKLLLHLVLPLLGLSAFFWLLAFAPGASRQQTALLEMSVILREGDSTAASTLRKGIEQAAVDLNVELRFLAPSTANSTDEQAQLLAREVESAASAILLFPADRQALADAAGDAAAKAAVVTLETDMTEQGAKACVSVDNAALGKALARAAINGVSPGGTVLLLDSVPGDNGIRERLDSASAALRAAGRQVRLCPWTPEGDELAVALQTGDIGAVVAFEATALEAAAELARTNPRFPLLYGAGSSAAIAAGVERGRITAIAAENAFTAGYLAVEAAAAAARREPVSAMPALDFAIIRQENMYNADNQKLLFPVT